MSLKYFVAVVVLLLLVLAPVVMVEMVGVGLS